MLSLFGLATLYRPYRPELLKWPKVGQNGSKIEKKSCHAISDEIPHILMVSSIFFVFGDFQSNFRFLLSLFGLAPVRRPYRPELVKWPKVGQNRSKIEKKKLPRDF